MPCMFLCLVYLVVCLSSIDIRMTSPATATTGAPVPPPPDVTIHHESDLIERIPISRASAAASTSRKRPKPYAYRCRRCHITNDLRCRILAHVRTHADILKLPCTSCGIRFATNASLRRHIRSTCKHMSKTEAADECSHPSPAAAPALAPAPAPAAPTAPAAPLHVPAPAPAALPTTCTAPAPGDVSFVLFDVADVVQVYPPLGSDLRRCNSIVYTGRLRRSDVYPHLNGQPVVYKSCNPALDATYVRISHTLPLRAHRHGMHMIG
jgi:cell division septation protein DedD